jgi:phosphotriesterase-related protein
VLIAAAKAQRATGVGLIVHTYPWGQQGLAVVDLLERHQVPPEKISISHVDVEIDLEYCTRLLKRGVFVEFDNFGKEYFIDRRFRGFAGGVFARDIERVHAVKRLIDGGYLANLLMSCDVCLKTLLHKYGGWGYDHILTDIVPMMLDEGISAGQIEALLKDNPRRFLDVTP